MSMKKVDEQMSAGVAHEEVMGEQLAEVMRLWQWTKRRESYGSTPLAGWRRWRPPGQSLVTWSVAAIYQINQEPRHCYLRSKYFPLTSFLNLLAYSLQLFKLLTSSHSFLDNP